MTSGDPTDRPHPFQWACPFCKRTRVLRPYSEQEDQTTVHNRAVAALRGHIHSSDGGGHGPRNAYPRDFDPDSIGDYVRSLDE